MLHVQLKHAAFQNISKLNHFVDILHGQTNDFIAIARDISQNIVSAECLQSFTYRRLTALILFYQIFFIQNFTGTVFQRQNIFQYGIVDRFFQTAFTFHNTAVSFPSILSYRNSITEAAEEEKRETALTTMEIPFIITLLILLAI